MATEAAKNDLSLVRYSHPYSFNLMKRISEQYKVKRTFQHGVFVSSADLIADVLADEETWQEIDWSNQMRDFFNPSFGFTGLAPIIKGELHQKVREMSTLDEFRNSAASFVDGLYNTFIDDLELESSVDLVEFFHDLSIELVCWLVGVAHNADFEHRKNEIRVILYMISRETKPVTRIKKILENKNEVSALADFVLASYRRGPKDTPLQLLKAAGFEYDEARTVIIESVFFVVERIRAVLPRMAAYLAETKKVSSFASKEELEDIKAELLRNIVPVPIVVMEALKDGKIASLEVNQGEEVVLSSLFAAQRDTSNSVEPERYTLGRTSEFSQTLFDVTLDGLLSALRYTKVEVVSKTSTRKSLAGAWASFSVKAVS